LAELKYLGLFSHTPYIHSNYQLPANRFKRAAESHERTRASFQRHNTDNFISTQTHNMTAEEIQQTAEPAPAPASEPAPAVPDYLASPNAVFGDEGVQWRYGRAPDYSKTRKVWEEGKSPIPG